MILLLIFIVVVIAVICYVVFKTPEIPVDHPDNKPQIAFDAEKKYVESLRILTSMSEHVPKTK
jgi:preprotein translocase subunit SecY